MAVLTALSRFLVELLIGGQNVFQFSVALTREQAGSQPGGKQRFQWWPMGRGRVVEWLELEALNASE